MIPGFVDSHTHLVFAGDRAEEFAARMAGAPVRGGRHPDAPSTSHARRPDGRAAATGARAPARRRCAPGSPIWRSSPATRSTSTARRGCASWPASSPTTSPSSAPTSSRPSTSRARRLRRARVRRDARAPARPYARWIDVFCEDGRVRRRAVAGGAARPGAPPGLGLRVHANQLGPGAGVRLAVELEAASADHCTHLDRRRRRGAGRLGHCRHLLSGDRLLDPPALSGRPPR